MHRILKDNGLTIVLMLMFIGSIVGHLIAGWRLEGEELLQHGDKPLSLSEYAVSAAFLSSVFENWESEFLQMGAFVVLAAWLVQRGSAESNDPDSPPRDANLAAQAMKPGASTMLRRGALARWLYAHSLGLALFALFIVSFIAHWLYSAGAAAEEAAQHGQRALSAWDYLGNARFWFESFQNWQSEFLSAALLVVFSIFLRQKESSQSKAVAAPHSQTGE